MSEKKTIEQRSPENLGKESTGVEGTWSSPNTPGVNALKDNNFVDLQEEDDSVKVSTPINGKEVAVEKCNRAEEKNGRVGVETMNDEAGL